MKNKQANIKCPICGGSKKKGTTTFTAELGFGVVVVRDVPATVCSLCGSDWVDNRTAVKLEKIVSEARRKHNIVEVTTMSVQ